METGSRLPAPKETGNNAPTVTGAVKVVLLNEIACASADVTRAPRTMKVFIMKLD